MTESAAPAIASEHKAKEIDLSNYKLISQGAEAVSMKANAVCMLDKHCISSHPHMPEPANLPQRVWEGTYLDVPAVIKQRFSKKYRHASLDSKITQSRLKQVPHLHHPRGRQAEK